jgi:hypothetical protein
MSHYADMNIRNISNVNESEKNSWTRRHAIEQALYEWK